MFSLYMYISKGSIFDIDIIHAKTIFYCKTKGLFYALDLRQDPLDRHDTELEHLHEQCCNAFDDLGQWSQDTRIKYMGDVFGDLDDLMDEVCHMNISIYQKPPKLSSQGLMKSFYFAK